MVNNVWKFGACSCIPTFAKFSAENVKCTKKCKNLEFPILPKFSRKWKTNKNRVVSGLHLTTRNVGFSSRKVWAESNFRHLRCIEPPQKMFPSVFNFGLLQYNSEIVQATRRYCGKPAYLRPSTGATYQTIFCIALSITLLNEIDIHYTFE